jgi:exodeoxyribonuclease VII large subunit
MSGSVEFDAEQAQLVIRFPYREDLVAAVKELPERRWDPRQKVWRVPAAHIEQVHGLLSRHLFAFAPECMSLLAGTLLPSGPAAGPTRTKGRQLPLPDGEGTAPVALDGGPPSLRISQLNTLVRDGLRRQFPEALWITGEILDFDKSAGRPHRFFQLVEKASAEAAPAAKVEVALFGTAFAAIQARLGQGDGALVLRDGLEVRLQVRLDFYVASGRFQVLVQDIDPSFTLGKMALSREQILRELREHGLLDRNRQLGFPVPALRIGLLTSPDADGCHDFLRQLQESAVGFAVTLLPIKVQGPELKQSLLAGLAWFAANAAQFDVLCIVRGGGSRSDLAWFDDRELAFAVARHPLKILVGIGHQRDQSVLDLIAHSAKTPTAVAALLVEIAEGARQELALQAERLVTAVQRRLAAEAEHLQRLARRSVAAVQQRLHREALVLRGTASELVAAVRLRLQREAAQLRAAAVRGAHAAERSLDRARARLEQATARHRLLDPARVLGRGYTLVRDAHGRVLPALERMPADATIEVQFRDGRATARVLAQRPEES